MRKLILSIITLIAFNLTSCSSDDDIKDGGASGGTQVDVNEFIWGAMNSWYYWQDQVPDLSDKIGNNAYSNLINNNSSEALFDKLLYQKDIVDRFSWIEEDYEVLHNSLYNSKNESYGMDFVLVSFENTADSDVFGYVRYVLPNTSAAAAGLNRGDLFLTVNGEQLKVNNLRRLLTSQIAELGLAKLENYSFSLTGEKKVVNMETVVENPVFYTDIINVNGKKVGYLVYNSFQLNYHDELNAVFEKFKAENVQEFVLDLRYNRGGATITAQYLSSMLTGQFTNQLLAEFEHNSKQTTSDEVLNFVDKMVVFENSNPVSNEKISSLNLNKVYILTTDDTASASEFIINGLNPYIEVVKIGTRTSGKNVGSQTLYDVPNNNYQLSDRYSINPSHKYVIQPITFSLKNSVGFGDYANGFEPDILVDEFEYIENLLPLGDPNEPLLNAALKNIDPSYSSSRLGSSKLTKKNIIGKKLKSSKDFRPHSMEMYREPQFNF